MTLNPDQFPQQAQVNELRAGDRVHVTVGDPMGVDTTMLSGRFLRADATRLHMHVDGDHVDDISSVKHEHVRSVFRGGA